jgi:6-phosphogluconolactonase
MQHFQFNSKTELIHEFSQWLITFLLQKLQEADVVHIAISGGSTPLKLFEYLSAHELKRLDWSKIHIWWVDERFVPHNSLENNFNNAMKAGLSALPATYHRISTNELSFESAVENYQMEFKKYMRGKPLDLVVLGAGEDGHTASLFTTNMHLINDSIEVVGTINPHSGQKRVSLNFNQLIKAERTALLLSGEVKSTIFMELEKSENFPVCVVMQKANAGVVFKDF